MRGLMDTPDVCSLMQPFANEVCQGGCLASLSQSLFSLAGASEIQNGSETRDWLRELDGCASS